MKKKIPIILLLALMSITTYGQQFRVDNSKPIEAQLKELISKMTLQEKVGQMMHAAPAIERLGIPAYNWWNECLHGVGRAGLATVYPQAIGLAATFDDSALLRSATIISDEARAKYHDAVSKGERGIYQGLTFWSPNINIFRDPRWGRGQETYGEDPYLTAQMGIAFVKGLQGDNPDFMKVVATAKHFAVHSGPEPERHVFDARPSTYDFWDTYLPAFEALVRKAKVASIMGAYNLLDGIPCCGSEMLQEEILRKRWGFDGYIVSDCGAIDDFYKTHKVYPNASTASADAVKAGTDLECGNSYRALKDAVQNGLITEHTLDISLMKLFHARYRLGMFTDDSKNPYAQIPYSVVDCADHRADALEIARKSIVLLKNDKNVLPLSKSIKKIAIVGPCANDSVSLLGNYNGTPGKTTTILQGIMAKAGAAGVEVKYVRGVNLLDDNVEVPANLWPMISADGKNGMKAEYFGNMKLEGVPLLTRVENSINFRGNDRSEIAPGVTAHNISVRWTGDFVPDKTDSFTFSISGDDGFRLFVNDEKVIDRFYMHDEMNEAYTFNAVKGQKYALRLEYFQGDQTSTIRFGGVKIEKTDYDALAREVADADVIIFAGGISPLVEGEEMPVNAVGFNKGDRTTMALPEVQTRMMQALKKSGKPVVFVMQTGSPLAVKWEKENVDAIMNIWYGGQAIGAAVADVLWGDYNPAGRLPVTFYASDNDLPRFEDYSMMNRTYRYFHGEPLFAFGYGMSYSKFGYSELKIQDKASTGENIKVSVKVTNNGPFDGEEVVQLYVRHIDSKYQTPIRALKGFKRISLKNGESHLVEFVLSPEDLYVIKSDGTRVETAGGLEIFVGGGQPGSLKELAEKSAGVAKTIKIVGKELSRR